MPTSETNLAVKSASNSAPPDSTNSRLTDPSAATRFQDAFDGASLAGIRGFSDSLDQTSDRQMAGIRGFSEEDNKIGNLQMAGIRGFADGAPIGGFQTAGIRGFSDQSLPDGGTNFADTQGMMNLRRIPSDGLQPSVQLRNTGLKAYQDMLGMPAIAVG